MNKDAKIFNEVLYEFEETPDNGWSKESVMRVFSKAMQLAREDERKSLFTDLDMMSFGSLTAEHCLNVALQKENPKKGTELFNEYLTTKNKQG